MECCVLDKVFDVTDMIDEYDTQARVVYGSTRDQECIAGLKLPFDGLLDYLFNDDVKKFHLLLVRNCQDVNKYKPYDFIEAGNFDSFQSHGHGLTMTGDFLDFQLSLHVHWNCGIHIHEEYHAVVKNIE